MKPNVLITSLALIILCTCAVTGAGAVELYAEVDAAATLGEWDDWRVIPTTAVDLVSADGVESAIELCSDLDAVLDECDDLEITPTVAEKSECKNALMTEYTAATAGNLQPLFKAPWEGEKRITQGTYGSTSHYDHNIWDNTYALDIASLTPGEKFNVLAPYDGIVCLVDKEGAEYPSSGKVVVIEHTFDGRKYYTVYLHLSEIFVDNKSELKQGQVFAISGNTGTSSTGVHLHFHLFGAGISWNSHTQPIERLELKRTGVDDDFRIYNMSKGDLNDSIVGGGIFESNNVPVSKEAIKTRDTVLVLDASGSMSGTPVTVMKEAAKIFCSEVLAASEKNRVSIVVYSSTVEKTLDFTSNLDSLNSTIDSIWADGGTNIGAAIDSASSLLSSSDADAKNIILMTDGLPQSGSYIESGRYSYSDIPTYYGYANYVYEQCSELKQSYNIYTLGFFHGLYGKELAFGQRFLNDIQNKGYYEVTDANELKFIFGELAEDITKEDYPIIIVHGIMGGKLYHDNFLIWIHKGRVLLGIARLDCLAYDSLTPPNSRVNLTALEGEREYGAQDSYKELVDYLCKQFPSRAVYFYSYDWRQSNDNSAAELDNLIEDVKVQTGYSKVDLVCHSMGGLVASSYVKQYGTTDVRYIITLATPYEGSPEIITRTLDERALGTGFIENIKGKFLVKNGLTKEIMVGMPSTAELVPTKRYFESTKLLKTGTKPTIGKVKSEDITYEEYCNIMRSIFGNNYDSAVIFQSSIEDALLNLDNAYFAVATGKKTVKEVIINDKVASFEALKAIELTYEGKDEWGDGTVPYISATMNGALPDKYKSTKDSAGNSRYREFVTDHTSILSHKTALLWVKDILNQTSNPYEEIDKINYPGYTVIRIACPIDVSIDVNGEILSSDPEMGSMYVPNGRLDFIGDGGVMICLEDTGTAQDITIVGTGEGTMDYDISWYDADSTLTETRSLEAVPITTTTTITTTTDNTEPTVLNIDSDGDGVVETQWSVDASGETVVTDLKPYIAYSDGGSDTSSFAVTTGSVSFANSAGITSINFPDGVKGMVILDDPSPEITPPENTYATFDISAPPFEGSAEINFVIPSAILVDSGYSKMDVVMKHYIDKTWQNLPTFFVREERGAASYMATTTSFSPFAIVYEIGGTTITDTGSSQKPSIPGETAVTPTVDETQPAGEGTIATGERQTAVPLSETTKKAEAAATKSPAPVIGMLFALGAATLLWRRA